MWTPVTATPHSISRIMSYVYSLRSDHGIMIQTVTTMKLLSMCLLPPIPPPKKKPHIHYRTSSILLQPHRITYIGVGPVQRHPKSFFFRIRGTRDGGGGPESCPKSAECLHRQFFFFFFGGAECPLPPVSYAYG